jgi:hypothetical protein
MALATARHAEEEGRIYLEKDSAPAVVEEEDISMVRHDISEVPHVRNSVINGDTSLTEEINNYLPEIETAELDTTRNINPDTLTNGNISDELDEKWQAIQNERSKQACALRLKDVDNRISEIEEALKTISAARDASEKISDDDNDDNDIINYARNIEIEYLLEEARIEKETYEQECEIDEELRVAEAEIAREEQLSGNMMSLDQEQSVQHNDKAMEILRKEDKLDDKFIIEEDDLGTSNEEEIVEDDNQSLDDEESKRLSEYDRLMVEHVFTITNVLANKKKKAQNMLTSKEEVDMLGEKLLGSIQQAMLQHQMDEFIRKESLLGEDYLRELEDMI